MVLEPRPGGAVHTPIRGPGGAAIDEGPGCILVVEPERIFAFTDAMAPGFHPTGSGFMTGVYILAPTEAGTKITVRALHANVDARSQHAEMGFSRAGAPPSTSSRLWPGIWDAEPNRPARVQTVTKTAPMLSGPK